MGIFGGRWKSPKTKKNFSKFVKEKLEELRDVGCNNDEIARVEAEIEKTIQEGYRNDFIENNINRSVNLAKTARQMREGAGKYVENLSQKRLEGELERIKRDYPEEEQEFYETYAKEQYNNNGKQIDLNKVIKTIGSHMKTVGFGQAKIDKFIDDIKKKQNSTLSDILGKLNGELEIIRTAKKTLTENIENARDPKKLSETDRMFERIYGSEYQKNGENYLEQLTNNRTSIMQTEFDIKFGHDKKSELISLATEQLTLLGYSPKVVKEIKKKISETTKGSDGADFIAKVSQLTQGYAQRNKMNIEDYTYEQNMSMIGEISDKFGMIGEEGTKKFIRELLSLDNVGLENKYREIDERMGFIPPDRSAEIKKDYDERIQKHQEIQPDSLDTLITEKESQLAQWQSKLNHVSAVRF